MLMDRVAKIDYSLLLLYWMDEWNEAGRVRKHVDTYRSVE